MSDLLLLASALVTCFAVGALVVGTRRDIARTFKRGDRFEKVIVVAVVLIGLLALSGVLARIAGAADTRTAAPTRTRTATFSPPPSRTRTATRSPSRTRTPRVATATRTSSSTRPPTSTRTSTRAQTATRTPTFQPTPRNTATARVTPPGGSPAPTGAVVVSPPSWMQGGAGPGKNSYRGDIEIDPMKLVERSMLRAAPGESIFRAQLVEHPAGMRAHTFEGKSGGYDNWRRIDGSDHTPAGTGQLYNLDFKLLDEGGFFSAVSPLYEGNLFAWWPHPTLRNYVIGRVYEGGRVGLTVDSVTGSTLTQGLMGEGYVEETGPIAMSLELDLVCYMNFFARHGGTASGVWCQSIRDQERRWGHIRNEPWNQVTTRPDNIWGGLALAEKAKAVVFTANFDRPWERYRNGLYVFAAKATAAARCTFLGEAEYSAPAVGPDGVTIYLHKNGNTLVEVNAETCAYRETPMTNGSASAWPAPPMVTDKLVILTQTNTFERGDLQAYSRETLEPAWRLDAGIIWHRRNLSGWMPQSDFYTQADRATIYYGGYGAIRAARLSDGLPLPWMWTAPEPSEWYTIQLYCDGATGKCGLLAQSTSPDLTCATCEAEMCPDGLPIGSTDVKRCCAGPTRRCPTIDCEKCFESIGFCPHDPHRRCQATSWGAVLLEEIR